MGVENAVPTIGLLEPDHCLASWSSVYIVIFRRHTTLAGVGELRHRFAQFAATRPGGVGLLTIVEADAPVPGSEERAALANFMRVASSSIRSSAVVHEGSGFRAAAVRGVVTGLTLLARQPFPHKVFATVATGCEWLAGSLKTAGVEVDAHALIAAVAELRERVAAG